MNGSGRDTFFSTDGATTLAWFIAPPEGTSVPGGLSGRVLLGYREELLWTRSNGGQQQVVSTYFQSSLSVGLPFTSLNSILYSGGEPDTLFYSSTFAGRTLRVTNRSLAFFASARRAGVADTSFYIPTLPYWPGLIANTVVWGAVAWVMVFGVRRLRAILRRRKGLCTACAFPLHQLPRCPECGTPSPHSTILAA